MEQISGYAKILASARAKQEATKPLIGKPTLKYGQCYAMAGYFMQLGAVLAVKYRDKLDAFGHAFLGATGEPGAMQRFVDLASPDIRALVSAGMTFSDYVTAEQIKRLQFKGDPDRFFFEMGMQKLDLETSLSMIWQFAEQGAILGAADPIAARAVFDQTHAPRDQADWDRDRAAGLDIPEKQDVMSWEEVQEGENEGFMAYCQQCAPSLYAALRG